MPLGFLLVLPPSLFATATALGYGSFTFFYGMGAKIAQDQAVVWQHEQATIAGHPGAFSYGILLLGYIGLFQIPAVAIGVYALKHDRAKIERICREAGPLLEQKTDPLLEADYGVGPRRLCCGCVVGV